MRTCDGVRHLFLIFLGDHLFLAVVKIVDNLFVLPAGWCYLETRLYERVVLRVIRHIERRSPDREALPMTLQKHKFSSSPWNGAR
jgi:hypothetical protein